MYEHLKKKKTREERRSRISSDVHIYCQGIKYGFSLT